MGKVIIANGIYSISHSEGEAIAGFTPPRLDHINWDLLSDRQTFLISEYAKQQEIISNWLVYFRTKSVNIKQPPFTFDIFQDVRPKAELLNNLLDLCGAVWESLDDKILDFYPTPAAWWGDCVLEDQKAFLNRIVICGEMPTKTDIEKSLRDLQRNLLNEKIPKASDHTTKLYNLAIKNMSIPAVRQAWGNYLKSITACAKVIKNNNEIKSLIYVGNNNLGFYQDRNKLVYTSTPRIEKDWILNSKIVYQCYNTPS